MRKRFTAAAVLAALLCACESHVGGSLSPLPPQAVASQDLRPPVLAPLTHVKRMCPDAPFGAARCFAWMRTDILGTGAMLPDKKLPGYGPADFQSAYKLPSKNAGTGQTVGIVDAYNDPTAESDLAVYRSYFRLPACTKANRCLSIVNQKGQTSPLPSFIPGNGWAGEESLDLDMVSAICPNCKILLVEATTGDFNDLRRSVMTAVKKGAAQVSLSWGGVEYAPRDFAFARPGKAIIVAAAGDNYLSPAQPASFSTVVSVGGTQLKKTHNKRGWTETVWNDSYVGRYIATGSGCSNYVAKPAWQTDVGCSTRVSNDTAASADCVDFALIYNTSAKNAKGNPLGWVGACGTSEAAPIVAGIYALAGNAAAISSTYAQSIYLAAGTSALNPVTKGNNWEDGPCAKVIRYVCTAGPGYNGPAGWGTPNGVSAL
jgi:hypothetical protein